ncbi:YxeA family protein [Paenibacillus sp. D2_2]|uniref:YxeA family protein n=1 Tax=Paenibacillus sp. D2_2 TaxID=3073092 RepID=UPI0028158F98|nr:YxeA family protein [Paenibacillus sp. D2_2]WMT40444.1 YxeA family protein [Paenibacillus sp. D2_2]
MKGIKLLVAIFSCVSVLMLFGCSNENKVMFEEDYYVQIGDKVEQSTQNDEQYIYNVTGYDKDGKEKVVSFFSEKMYDKGTLIRIPRSLEGYTGEPTVIGADELPVKVKEKLGL